jgi:hypothetical protein
MPSGIKDSAPASPYEVASPHYPGMRGQTVAPAGLPHPVDGDKSDRLRVGVVRGKAAICRADQPAAALVPAGPREPAPADIDFRIEIS